MRIIDEREQLNVVLHLVQDSQKLRQIEKEDSNKKQQELSSKIRDLTKKL